MIFILPKKISGLIKLIIIWIYHYRKKILLKTIRIIPEQYYICIIPIIKIILKTHHNYNAEIRNMGDETFYFDEP